MPVSSRTAAKDEIYGLFKTAWDAGAASSGLPVHYRDISPAKVGGPSEDPKVSGWARITIQHNAGRQASLSDRSGVKKWERVGTVSVQIFTKPGDGEKLSDLLTAVAVNAFEGKRTPSGIWFRDVSGDEVGIDDGWFQVNVTSTFEYHEIK